MAGTIARRLAPGDFADRRRVIIGGGRATPAEIWGRGHREMNVPAWGGARRQSSNDHHLGHEGVAALDVLALKVAFADQSRD